jgi:signal transduction histidine kinase
LVAAAQIQPGGEWMVVRSSIPARDPWLLVTLIAQTLFIYAVLVGAIALILRRIARPLAALTSRVDQFARTRESTNQIEPEGPADVRHLIEAHNAMEHRITTLINEKDVMLGAIGHDLKTPLAALRVRIEASRMMPNAQAWPRPSRRSCARSTISCRWPAWAAPAIRWSRPNSPPSSPRLSRITRIWASRSNSTMRRAWSCRRGRCGCAGRCAI